jgi:hypothetical protein
LYTHSWKWCKCTGHQITKLSISLSILEVPACLTSTRWRELAAGIVDFCERNKFHHHGHNQEKSRLRAFLS